jgi:hypothetical protein
MTSNFSSPSHLWRCQIAFKVHNNNQQLLEYNSQNGENRMFVFYSPDSLERLANAQTFFIFMDGTFSVAPHPFKQLYTIRVPFKDLTGSVVYGTDKKARPAIIPQNSLTSSSFL